MFNFIKKLFKKKEIRYAIGCRSNECFSDFTIFQMLYHSGYSININNLETVRKNNPVLGCGSIKDKNGWKDFKEKNLVEDEDLILLINLTQKEGDDFLRGINNYLRGV